MENGVEALKMASSMLIFVLAITITISVFTSATQALNRIFTSQEAEQYVTAIDEEGNEYFLNNVRFDGGTRIVEIETIIPSIYRAYKENYAIYFYEKNGTGYTEYWINTNDKGEQINYIDLNQENHATVEKAIESINKLLYETDGGLYNKLKGKQFTEMLGEYYMDDVSGAEETAEVNKVKKRLIVYILTEE